jgi:hypothetical protein
MEMLPGPPQLQGVTVQLLAVKDPLNTPSLQVRLSEEQDWPQGTLDACQKVLVLP